MEFKSIKELVSCKGIAYNGVSCVPSYFCPWGSDFAKLIDRGTL